MALQINHGSLLPPCTFFNSSAIGVNTTVKPITDVASKWTVVICSLQGVASSTRTLLLILNITGFANLAWYLLAMVYLQQITCNGVLAMATSI